MYTSDLTIEDDERREARERRSLVDVLLPPEAIQ